MSKSSAKQKFILTILILVTLLGTIGFLKNSRIGGLVNDNTGLHFVEKCSPKILPEKFNAFIGPKGWVHEYFNADKPIAGAKVEVLGQTVFTNAKGEFKIPKHDPCLETLAVTVTADGYDTEVTTTITPEEAWAPTYFPSFLLKPFGYSQEQADLKTSSALPEGSAYFISERDGKRSIYSINYNGSDRHRILKDSVGGEQFDLHVSPRDKYLAYLSTENAKTDDTGRDIPGLYIAKVDGSDSKILSGEKDIQSITWSADGTYLAWIENNGGQQTKLSSYNVVTGKATQFDSSEGNIFSFDYNNDDTQLVVSVEQYAPESNEIVSSSIWLLNGDVSNPKKIIPTQSYEQSQPRFLLNNDIEFNTSGTTYVYSMTSKKTTNTHTAFDSDKDLLISPDKSKAAYRTFRDGQTFIITTKSDGSEEGQIGIDVYPSNLHWTQNSRHIVYYGEGQLWIVSTQTPTDQRSITQITE